MRENTRGRKKLLAERPELLAEHFKRESYRKIFYDKEKLYLMVNMRINGWSFSSLALYWHLDISSIRHQCDKYQILPGGPVYTIERIGNHAIWNMMGVNIPVVRTKPGVVQWEEFNGVKYATGKSYKDYLKEAKYPPIKNH